MLKMISSRHRVNAVVFDFLAIKPSCWIYFYPLPSHRMLSPPLPSDDDNTNPSIIIICPPSLIKTFVDPGKHTLLKIFNVLGSFVFICVGLLSGSYRDYMGVFSFFNNVDRCPYCYFT